MDTIQLVGHTFCECGKCEYCIMNVRYCKVCRGNTVDTTHGSLTSVCRQVTLDDTALEQIRMGTFDFDGVEWRRIRTVSLRELLA